MLSLAARIWDPAAGMTFITFTFTTTLSFYS
jgi:hypothetical protein